MKKLLIVVCGLMLCASAAFGQGIASECICLYYDLAYTQCNYVDAGAALVPVYAVHMFSPGATASQWRLITGGGFNCTYTGEIVHMPTSIGSTPAGISLGYGGCLVSPILLVTINYFCMGTSPECAWLQVVGDPGSGSGLIEIVDCSFTAWIACANYAGGDGVGCTITMNGNETCPCVDGPCPTEESTWGRVKALY